VARRLGAALFGLFDDEEQSPDMNHALFVCLLDDVRRCKRFDVRRCHGREPVSVRVSDISEVLVIQDILEDLVKACTLLWCAESFDD
jgi:hypothetical protein